MTSWLSAAICCRSAVGAGAHVTIDEIERLELVVDPMNAVPNVPFGHLSANWVRMKAEQAPGHKLHRFSTEWTPSPWKREVRSGYVLVRWGAPGKYILTVCREVH